MGEYSKAIAGIKELVKDFLRQGCVELGSSEEEVQRLVAQGGAEALGEWWSERSAEQEANRESDWTCECGRRLRRRHATKKVLLTLLGPTTVRRNYHWCPSCGQGRYWLDEQLGCRGRAQTGAVQESVVMAAAVGSYAEAQTLLRQLAHLELPYQTVESIAADIGAELVSRRNAEVEAAQEDVLLASETPETLCISTDGVKVPTHDGWQEARVIAAFPYDRTPGGSDPEVGRVSYSGRIENCEATGRRMYAEAIQRGYKKAKRVAVIGDGADWIWNQAQEHFPGAIEVVDWYHATEHLWEVSNTVFGQGTQESKDWTEARKTELWEGQVQKVIDEMRHLFWKNRRDRNFRGSEMEHEIQTNLGYFMRHAHRMDYARFRREEIPIGSGVVESACKHFVAQRCKRSGMRWRTPGLHAILELRAALLSEEWSRVQHLVKAA